MICKNGNKNFVRETKLEVLDSYCRNHFSSNWKFNKKELKSKF